MRNQDGLLKKRRRSYVPNAPLVTAAYPFAKYHTPACQDWLLDTRHEAESAAPWEQHFFFAATARFRYISQFHARFHEQWKMSSTGERGRKPAEGRNGSVKEEHVHGGTPDLVKHGP